MIVRQLVIGSIPLAIAAFGIALSCGPSFRRTYHSDAAFEQCFENDFNPEVTSNEKSTCWQMWIDGHIYNQPEDKIDYAKLRFEEIARGVSTPGPPGPPGTFDRRPQLESADVTDARDTLLTSQADAGDTDTFY